MTQTEETTDLKLKKLKFYRSEIKHEFTLLYDRVSAYVTSQSFLTIAFASAMNNSNEKWGVLFTLLFPVGLALLGIVTSVRVIDGISSAIHTISMWHAKQNHLFAGDENLVDYKIQREDESLPSDGPVDAVHMRSLSFAKFTPRVFLVAWCLFALLAVYLHFRDMLV